MSVENKSPLNVDVIKDEVLKYYYGIIDDNNPVTTEEQIKRRKRIIRFFKQYLPPSDEDDYSVRVFRQGTSLIVLVESEGMSYTSTEGAMLQAVFEKDSGLSFVSWVMYYEKNSGVYVKTNFSITGMLRNSVEYDTNTSNDTVGDSMTFYNEDGSIRYLSILNNTTDFKCCSHINYHFSEEEDNRIVRITYTPAIHCGTSHIYSYEYDEYGNIEFITFKQMDPYKVIFVDWEIYNNVLEITGSVTWAIEAGKVKEQDVDFEIEFL